MATELMKQSQFATLSVSEMALTLFALNKGYLDDVEVKRGLAFEAALRSYMRNQHAEIMDKIETTKNLDDAAEQALSAAIEEFKKNWDILTDGWKQGDTQ